MKFIDIPAYTICGAYRIDVQLRSVPETIRDFKENSALDMNPDFQRGHVWTVDQQQAFVVHILRGGTSGRDIYFNCPSYGRNAASTEPMVIVDGKQRITACLDFLDNKFPILGGYYFRDFEDRPRVICRLTFHVNDLENRAEILQWYLEMNTGGTVHSEEEISKVKRLLEKELK